MCVVCVRVRGDGGSGDSGGSGGSGIGGDSIFGV